MNGYSVYKIKLCKIKWRFSGFTLDGALTPASTALAFLRLWEPQPSICLCAWSHWACCAEAGNPGMVASTELVFPRLPPTYVGSEEALLLLPLASLFLECCFSCVICLWITERAKTICLKIRWACGVVYSDVCTLFSVSQYLFWWFIFHYWEDLFSQIPRV